MYSKWLTVHILQTEENQSSLTSSLFPNEVIQMPDRIHQTQQLDKEQDNTWTKFRNEQPQTCPQPLPPKKKEKKRKKKKKKKTPPDPLPLDGPHVQTTGELNLF